MSTVTEVDAKPVSAHAASANGGDGSFAGRAWDFLISLKLAIWTLILLAVASTAGTVIEQNQPMDMYRQVYEDWAFRLIERFGLYDMYHSWWFVSLLCLFAVNLACCTIDRLPRTIRAVRNPKLVLDEATEKSLAAAERWKGRGDVPRLAEECRASLARAFAAPTVTEAGGAVHLYAEKGVYSRFGAYATHAGIVIVFAGSIVGNLFGFNSYMTLPDGAAGSHIDIRGGREHMDLPFAVRNNRFWMENYPGGQPKEYSSDLSVLENGREVARKTITVNDPLVYKGIWFYQSGYGNAGVAARVSATRPDGSPLGTFLLPPDEAVAIEGYGTVRGIRYEENFEGAGPALRVAVEKPGAPAAEAWIFRDPSRGGRLPGGPAVFSLEGIAPRNYTGLRVAKDPGVNLVWLGCLILTAGMMLSFFGSHRRIWIRLSGGKPGRVEIAAGGVANRNRPAFEKAFAAVVAQIRREISDNATENRA